MRKLDEAAQTGSRDAAAMMAAHMRGFLPRFLSFIGCSMVVFAGGNWIFEKDLPGHIWLLMGGLLAAMMVLRPGKKLETKQEDECRPSLNLHAMRTSPVTFSMPS